jgi:CheY-like chemotaxis protein
MSEALTMPPPAEVAVKRAPTVYFIDDSATMREVIKIAFRRENINVITCGDAASAMAQFEQNPPDVVVTDVIMPGQDGFAVCSQIKQHPQFGAVPVVLMSGVVNKSVADKAVSVKADELIRKPFQPQELIGRVKSLLAPKQPAAPTTGRTNSYAMQNLFVPGSGTSSPTAAPPTVPPTTAAEPAWPKALAEAFAPMHAASNGSKAATPSTAPPASNPPTKQQPAATSSEVAKLRGEIARVELLVKKLQTELQLEREYNQALEQQIRTLLAAS